MDQINLRDIIKLIIKRKWIILGFTACCVIVSAVVSMYFVTPSYSHRTIFNISPVDLKTGLEQQETIISAGVPGSNETYNKHANRMLGAILNKMSYPRYDADSVASMIGSAEFKDRVFSGNDLGSKVSMQVSGNKDLNQITIVSLSQFPEELLKVGKAVKDFLPGYISGQAAKSVEKSAMLVKDGLKIENENLNKYKKEISEFIARDGGKVENLSSEAAVRYRDIENNYVLAAQAYDSYKIIEKEMSLIKTGSIESMLNLQLSYEDSAPVKISPKIKVNLILAFVAGFMFILFFLTVFEFWYKKQS
ncbi:Wzz/FepE/Etk N-terminal domain-containing protein [Pseudobacteroides cellulosolvens]|uniref:Lipopolysaccharide biosynthesis protein n=1 Tax=Pseudobacteroides cellulosolvens ATCC 35603 = DSM 2933 TaxID=398512 RepID=A0A0L6JVI6_9FIRM|nr:Wzz/FepE/Etk N-terminal domain-containing protein [Pseudobacteroides cellulosolvens]KNY29655.1 lipopolysaccharide biosynthesis protein [Pseudobacteroides cellulosolvens ATCC 35603 = DSM 2933]